MKISYRKCTIGTHAIEDPLGYILSSTSCPAPIAIVATNTVTSPNLDDYIHLFWEAEKVLKSGMTPV